MKSVAFAWLLVWALGAAAPHASAGAYCPQPAEVMQADVLGQWRAEFEGHRQGATLLLEKNAVYSESLGGSIDREGDRARLAGDLEDGELTLEESADGVRISATWIGSVTPGSCGREIRGTWRRAGEERARAFVLRKV